jgi:hypothetical protein
MENTMTFYLIANVQDLENYGAHDWDGEGECPQYWKFKGGTSLGVEIAVDDLTARPANYAARALALLAEHDMLDDNEYFKSYFLNAEVVDARDLFIETFEADDEEPGHGYEYYGLVRFPHLPEGQQSRFCWKKVFTPPRGFRV